MIKGLLSRTFSGDSAQSSWGGWRCAGFAVLTLACFIGLNIAGCGGSSGGGLSAVKNPTVTIKLLLTGGGVASNVTVIFNGKQQVTNSAGVATYPNIAPGSYTLAYTIGGQSSSVTIAVSSDASQTFVAVQGQTSVGANGIVIRGFVYNNNDATTDVCASTALGVTDSLLVRVRDLNSAGEPIVASYIKPRQDAAGTPVNVQGSYQFFNIPNPGTYEVEVRPAPGSPVPWVGQSASFTINAGQTINNLTVCANQNGILPGVPPPPGTPTPGGTPTAGPTSTLQPSPTPTTFASNTPIPTTTPTAIPTDTPTPTPTNTPTPTPTNTPTPTATP